MFMRITSLEYLCLKVENDQDSILAKKTETDAYINNSIKLVFVFLEKQSTGILDDSILSEPVTFLSNSYRWLKMKGHIHRCSALGFQYGAIQWKPRISTVLPQITSARNLTAQWNNYLLFCLLSFFPISQCFYLIKTWSKLNEAILKVLFSNSHSR